MQNGGYIEQGCYRRGCGSQFDFATVTPATLVTLVDYRTLNSQNSIPCRVDNLYLFLIHVFFFFSHIYCICTTACRQCCTNDTWQCSHLCEIEPCFWWLPSLHVSSLMEEMSAAVSLTTATWCDITRPDVTLHDVSSCWEMKGLSRRIDNIRGVQFLWRRSTGN